MQSKCSWNVVEIQSKCSQNSVKMQLKCSQNTAKIQSNYSKNAAKIQSFLGVLIDWISWDSKISINFFSFHLIHWNEWRSPIIRNWAKKKVFLRTLLNLFSWNQMNWVVSWLKQERWKTSVPLQATGERHQKSNMWFCVQEKKIV